MEHHLALAVKSVLVMAAITAGQHGQISREDIDCIVAEGFTGYKKVVEKIIL